MHVVEGPFAGEVPEVRVMLVDDQDLLRSGFRLLLMAEPDIRVVADADSGERALDELAALDGQVDVVLMDVRMPGMNGIEATRKITERYPDVRVLVLTTFDGDQYVADAVSAGAAGFLLKDATPEDLVAAIHRVHCGDAVMAPAVATRIWEQLRQSPSEVTSTATRGNATLAAGSADAKTATPHTVMQKLTEREREVLALIAAGKNNREIMGELFLSESTVKTHIGRIFDKLNLRDRVHAVIFAKDHGLA